MACFYHLFIDFIGFLFVIIDAKMPPGSKGRQFSTRGGNLIGSEWEKAEEWNFDWMFLVLWNLALKKRNENGKTLSCRDALPIEIPLMFQDFFCN